MIDTTGPSSWDPANNYANSYTCCASTIGEIIRAPASDTLLDSFTLYVRSDPPHPVYTATLRGEVYQWDAAAGTPVGSGLWESAPRPVSFTRAWTELTFRPANVRLVTGQRYILFISPNRDNPSGQATQSTGWASTSHPNADERAWAAFSSFTSPDFTSSSGMSWNCYGCSSPSTDLAFKATLLPGAQPPTVTTGPASGVTSSKATLSGSVNPNGVSVTDCHFEYGLSTAYGASAPCSPPPGAGDNAADVTAAVSGLQGNMPYHYRLVATNSSGVTGDGSDRTVTTASAKPNKFSVTGEVSSSSGAVTIKLNVPGPGSVDAAASHTDSAKKGSKPKKLIVASAHAHASKGGPFTITLKASGKAKPVLSLRHKLTAKVKITFTPTGGKAATRTLTVTFEQTKAK
jgi:hypothetical protein